MKAKLLRPPMGWNSYDYYDTTVNEKQVRANAAYMAENLKEYGWEYVVIDIAWYSTEAGTQRDRWQYIPFAHLETDAYARLLPDPARFPSSAGRKGFGPLADYIHDLGLKFGIHIMRGIPRHAAYARMPVKGTDKTANEIADPYSICAWNPHMYGVRPGADGQKYYDSLAELYASWGVDFIKMDDICRMDAASSREEIRMMARALEKCGRDIVLSLSPGPAIPDEAAFYHENAHMWRITDDFWDRWDLLRDMFDRCRTWQDQVRTGGYPDCDMLPLGKLGRGFGHERDTNFTFDEQKTMLTLWSIFRSPLMLGAEMTKLDPRTLSLLQNGEVYRMDAAVTEAWEARRENDLVLWEAFSQNARYAALFNLSDEEKTAPDAWLPAGFGHAQELWTHRDRAAVGALTLPPHGTLLFKAEK